LAYTQAFSIAYYRIHQFDESISPDASHKLVIDALKEVRQTPGYEWLQESGKATFIRWLDTGEPFDQPVLIGRQYMLKLNQLVLHKINARSGLGGPYAAVTQQPVGGKANQGGQRMGEMEVWAIQAFGAANILNEMMTIKADDLQGRHQAYADIVQGNNISAPGRTAAFDGLCCEIRGLGMEVTLGKIVDSFEPVDDKSCSQSHAHPPATLEEAYMVSAVDKLEDNGVKMLEIPAGDYVPVVRPPVTPMITSITNNRGDMTPRLEVSQEPLIDDLSDEESASTSFMDRFIEEETKALLVEKGLLDNASVEAQDEVETTEKIDQSPSVSVTQSFVDFPSPMELETLASELMNLKTVDVAPVGAKQERNRFELEKDSKDSDEDKDS
jgi:hypothetical protein